MYLLCNILNLDIVWAALTVQHKIPFSKWNKESFPMSGLSLMTCLWEVCRKTCTMGTCSSHVLGEKMQTRPDKFMEFIKNVNNGDLRDQVLKKESTSITGSKPRWAIGKHACFGALDLTGVYQPYSIHSHLQIMLFLPKQFLDIEKPTRSH